MTMTATFFPSSSTAPSGKQPSRQRERKRKAANDNETNHRDGHNHRLDDGATTRHHHQDGDGDYAEVVVDVDADASSHTDLQNVYLTAPFTPSAASSSTTNTTKNNNNATTSNNKQRPSWVPSRESFPWSSTTATYGHCTNVSSRYTKICRIGEGTYGVVYLAQDKTNDEQVALKRCLPHHEASDGFPITTLREIAILKELASAGGEKHGIISLRDVTVSSRLVDV
jgi:hypothetical protein